MNKNKIYYLLQTCSSRFFKTQKLNIGEVSNNTTQIPFPTQDDDSNGKCPSCNNALEELLEHNSRWPN